MNYEITDRTKFASVLLNVVLMAALLLHSWWCSNIPCYEAGETIVVHDTIYPKDTTLKLVSVGVKQPVQSIPKQRVSVHPVHSGRGDSSIPAAPPTLFSHVKEAGGFERGASPSPCDTVNIYSDTIRSDDMKAVINDTLVDNRLAGRSVWMVNLKPEVRTTTTLVKKEKWKVYVGGAVTVNQREMNRWGAGPSAMLTIPKVGGIGYYFDAKNFCHSASFMALIRFKK